MKDMGIASNCVGLRITYEFHEIYLDQIEYTKKILDKFNTINCKRAVTPSGPNQELSIEILANSEEEKRELKNNLKNRQQAVGNLLYLAQATRPVIVFAVNDLSRFNSNFGKAHWSAVKCIFR